MNALLNCKFFQDEYLATVQARIDTFMLHNPSVQKSDIPVEMVTASRSGLDPHISLKAAIIQVAGIGQSEKPFRRQNNCIGK